MRNLPQLPSQERQRASHAPQIPLRSTGRVPERQAVNENQKQMVQRSPPPPKETKNKNNALRQEAYPQPPTPGYRNSFARNPSSKA